MTNSKKTKQTLLVSVLSALLCLSLLIGSTFAWFTDSASSGINKIVAGKLDVELEYKDADGNWQPVNENTGSLFKPTEGDDATLWEPGHTEYVELRIRNAGSLALTYNFDLTVSGKSGGEETSFINVNGKEVYLSDFLVFNKVDTLPAQVTRESLWIADDAEEKAAMGTKALAAFKQEKAVLLPNDSPVEFTLAVYMPTWVGNEANYRTGDDMPEIQLGITLKAAQYTFESDSFDEQYDKDAEKELLVGASVAGIQGFENVIFPSIQAAYDAINPVIAQLGGLGQESASNEEFDAVYTDGGNITWTIYGEQTVSDSRIFSFGRAASYYNGERSITSINLVGGNDSAKLVMNTTINLPYNWWGAEFPTVSMTLSDLTLEQGAASIQIAPTFGYQFDLAFINCDIKGYTYCYWNGDFDLTFDGCNFQNIPANTGSQYALLVQGNDKGSADPVVTFINNTVEGYGRGVNLQCLNTEFTVNNNIFKSSTIENKGVLQITEGRKFTISGNTFESGVQGYAIDLHDLLANAEVIISDNTFNSDKYILNQITEENQATVTITETNNSGTAIPQP